MPKAPLKAEGSLAIRAFSRISSVRMNVWKHANPQLKDLVSYKPGKPIDESATISMIEPKTGVIFHRPPYTLISRVCVCS